VRRVLHLIALLAIALPAMAAWHAPDWTISLEERLVADDNILRLSDSDRSRLKRDPSFQPDVEGAGALRVDHRLGLALQWRLRSRQGPFAALQRWAGGRPGQGRLSLSWDGKWTQYEGSPANTYASHRLSGAWQPRPGWGTELNWRTLDNYYIRRFLDRDTGAERGATFDSDQIELVLKARGPDRGPWLRQPGLSLSAAWDRESYNPWFTEYDGEAWSLGLDLGWRMPAGLSAGLGWRFSDTHNVGYTGSQGVGTVNLGVDSEGGDGSHQEDQYSLSLGWSGRWGTRAAGLDAGLTLRDRWYQSRLGELQDPFHYGRHDRRILLSLRGRLALGASLTLIPVVEREWRNSEAAWGGISRVKDFEVLRAGLGLRWRLESD
jgi:hypothetical protein